MNSLKSAQPMSDIKEKPASPYVGPQPFDKEHSGFFCGRDREARDLVSLIQAHSIVLIYAPSGAGKTSLINASIIKRLTDNNCHVLPVARVGGDAKTPVKDGPGANIFVTNVIESIHKGRSDKIPDLSLAQYLLGVDAKENRNEEGKSPKLPKLSVLVIDQFEEIFTKHVEAWKHRLPFFEEIEEVLSNEQRVRIVLAMREEYLASLDPYVHLLPGELEIRYRLPLLGPEAARHAIEEPAKRAGIPFEEKVAENLVHSLRQLSTDEDSEDAVAEHVEPLQLQVVCSQIWDSLTAKSRSISADNLQTFGNVDDALRAYYDATIRKVMAAIKKQEINLQELAVRNWIEEKLIVTDGTRSLYYLRRENFSKPTAVHFILDILDREHLVRPEVRAGRRWYELSHDRFVGPIVQSNREFRERERGGGALGSLLEHIARDYAATSKVELLLKGEQLAEAEALVSKSSVDQEFAPSRAVHDLVRASQRQREHEVLLEEEARRRLESDLQKAALTKERELNVQLEESRAQLAVQFRSERELNAELVNYQARLEESRAQLAVRYRYLVALAAGLLIAVVTIVIMSRHRETALQVATAGKLGEVSQTLQARPESRINGLTISVLAAAPLVAKGHDLPMPAMSALQQSGNAFDADVLLQDGGGAVRRVQFSDDGKYLQVGGDGYVMAARVADGGVIDLERDDPKAQGKCNVDFAAGGTWLRKTWRADGAYAGGALAEHATCSGFVNLASGRHFKRSDFEIPDDMQCCDFSADGQYALASNSVQALLVDIESRRRVRSFPHEPDGDEGEFRFEARGSYIRFSRSNNTETLWDTKTGDAIGVALEVPQQFEIRESMAIRISEDGNYGAYVGLLESAEKTPIAIWNLRSREKPHVVTLDMAVPRIEFKESSPGLIAVGQTKSALQALDLDFGPEEPRTTELVSMEEFIDFDLSPNYLSIQHGSVSNPQVTIWDLRNPRQVTTLQLVGGARFQSTSPDAKYAAITYAGSIAGLKLLGADLDREGAGAEPDALLARACIALRNQLTFTLVEAECANFLGALP
jgi:hypothetical protein